MTEITLSTGVRLEIKPVSYYAVNLALSFLTMPVVHISEKGRDEPNPGDPAYVRAMEEYANDYSRVVNDTLIMLGSKLAGVPEGVPGPDDEEWQDMLRSLDERIEIPTDPRRRYLLWVKTVAISTTEDAMLVGQVAKRETGTPEEEVGQAAEGFRGAEERDTNLGARRKAQRKDRD
jgi:hypothetical protein